MCNPTLIISWIIWIGIKPDNNSLIHSVDSIKCNDAILNRAIKGMIDISIAKLILLRINEDSGLKYCLMILIIKCIIHLLSLFDKIKWQFWSIILLGDIMNVTIDALLALFLILVVLYVAYLVDSLIDEVWRSKILLV